MVSCLLGSEKILWKKKYDGGVFDVCCTSPGLRKKRGRRFNACWLNEKKNKIQTWGKWDRRGKLHLICITLKAPLRRTERTTTFGGLDKRPGWLSTLSLTASLAVDEWRGSVPSKRKGRWIEDRRWRAKNWSRSIAPLAAIQAVCWYVAGSWSANHKNCILCIYN